MTPDAETPLFVAVGKVLKPYGVFGWVKVEILTTNPQRFREGNTFILEGREKGERIVQEEMREAPGALLIKFQGLENREQAVKLSGRLLLVTPEELGDSPNDSLWEHQLLGLRVRTMEGRELGEVVEVIETGANDVLVVEGERECLIPMIEEILVGVDLEEGTMVINPMPGLLED
jgi:16S rRNA processing protein RimM